MRSSLFLSALAGSFSFGNAEDATPSVLVTGTTGSCEEYRGTVCEGFSKTYYIPNQVLLSNGYQFPFSQEYMEMYIVRAIDVIQYVDVFFGSQCTDEMYRILCGAVFHQCKEVDIGSPPRKKALPLQSCREPCPDLVSKCPDLPTLSVAVGLSEFNMCKGDYSTWEKFIDTYPPAESYGHFYSHFIPRELLGKTLYSETDSYKMTVYESDRVDVPGAEVEMEFECVENEEVVIRNPGCITSCPVPLVAVYDNPDDACATGCRLQCPLYPFTEVVKNETWFDDSYSRLVRSERVIALLAFPLILAVTAFELRNAIVIGDRPNPFIAICCFTGLLYILLILLFVKEDLNGCVDGYFEEIPKFWSTPGEQYNSCAVMTCSIHILQVFVNSLLCFMIQLYNKFLGAVNFNRQPPAYLRYLYFFLVFGTPAISSFLTFIYGREKSDRILDGYFLWTTVRYLHRCGPIYNNSALESLSVNFPICLAVVASTALSVRLFILCKQVMFTNETQESNGSNTGRGFVRQTSRLARQMMFFSVVTFIIAVMEISSEFILRSKVKSFGVDIARFIVCANTEGIVTDCNVEPLDKNIFFVLAINTASWSALPLAFGLFFASAIRMKRISNVRLRIKGMLAGRSSAQKVYNNNLTSKTQVNNSDISSAKEHL